MKRSIRPIRVEGETAFIPLGGGAEAIIDVADIGLVSGRNWHIARGNGCDYARANCKLPSGKWGQVKLHRVLMRPAPECDVDHINGDGLDNRRCNLRIATRSQNNMNARIRADNKSGHRGVFWRADRKRWMAYINANGKRQYLGHFKEKDDAKAAHARAAVELFGEFRRMS